VPRFFFDTRDDAEVIVDDIGLDLAGVEQAKIYAAKSLAELAVDVLPGATRRCLGVDVSDHRRRLVLSTELTYEARLLI
jgi:hypothetical protein